MLTLIKGDYMPQEAEIKYEKRMSRAKDPAVKQYWREKWIESLHSEFQSLIKLI